MSTEKPNRSDRPKMTRGFGSPLPNDTNSRTAGDSSAGTAGPIVMEDAHLLEKLAHFNRERIPERVVHAKGAGAYGTFRCTRDMSEYTCANFVSEEGKEVETFLRFSTVGGEKGSADAERDPRGFALRFYTEEGNYDLVGNNTPIFFIRDPLKFPDFIHTQKRDPQTNLKDADMFWDFLTLTPESLHQATVLFSNRGTPRTYRHMNGYGSHTFMWYNAEGDHVWVKYHFKTNQGVENFTGDEATKMAGENPDHATQDLFDAIEGGDYPTWRACVQIMTPEEAAEYDINPFDVTKVWPHGDFPLIEIGELELNRNPQNYFAEVEQAAFGPSNFVPGIGPSPDKMLQGRLVSYTDAHRYRVGTNYAKLPVNRPHATEARNYQRDGAMAYDFDYGSTKNYWPNSFDGPVPTENDRDEAPGIDVQGLVRRQEYATPSDNFSQVRALFSEVMSDEDRKHLIKNIVGHLQHAEPRIQKRAAKLFYQIHSDYGSGVANGLAEAGSSINPDDLEAAIGGDGSATEATLSVK